MDFSILWLIAAFGGGAFGAAIGPQTAFVFTCILYLVGLGAGMGATTTESQEAVNTFMAWGTYGPLFGPHIAFAGGAAATAYAHWKGYHPNGRDIVTPLPVYEKLDVMAVGGLFGIIGSLFNGLWKAILPPLTMSNGEAVGSTDTIAMSVISVAIVARIVFGVRTRSPIPKPAQGSSLFGIEEGHHWVQHQEKYSHSTWYGFTFGLIFAFTSAVLLWQFADNVMVTGHATNIGWAISGVSLFFITFGHKTPVTHHMTLIASIGSVVMMRILTDFDFASATTNDLLIATVFGGVMGGVSGFVGEALNRLSNARGDTHIDPPAFAIFPLTTALFAVQAIAM